ncbi:MAG: ATP-binding protein [Bacteroidota bacterium]
MANLEIALQAEERGKRAAELALANIELGFQNEEKGKRAAELLVANEELLFQNKEKEKRAAELIIANKELLFQNQEKGKRAEELLVANLELLFQNKEKESRAAELVIANTELLFQNNEKEKRAAELVIANIELSFQNEEKGKRAAELVIANTELLFQNDEKEKRAAELVIANKELLFQNEEKGKRAEELIQINNELESFCYAVSHDLHSPARKMGSYATLLEKKYAGKLDVQGDVFISSIIKNSKKMSKLIDDLLEFSRLGRKQIVESEINMNDLVKSVIDELTGDDNERTELVINPLLPSNGDESLIRQVWINLFSNAVKYSGDEPKARIEFGSHRKDDFIVYYIKDNGVGFDMQYYDKLFGIFQRLHSQEEFEGTGVGLATVQKIIRRHYGAVWAESVLGEGTCFYFSLPDPAA